MENAVLGQAWARGTTHAQGTKAAEKKTDPWVSFKMILIFHIICSKVGCVFLMVVVSMLPHAEIGRNDHREGAPHFI